jgi:hypothetical protein
VAAGGGDQSSPSADTPPAQETIEEPRED